jgi:hypothetical protein
MKFSKKTKKYGFYGLFYKNRDTFLIVIVGVGGGVQLGALGTETTNRPIVPAPGDYDD